MKALITTIALATALVSASATAHNVEQMRAGDGESVHSLSNQVKVDRYEYAPAWWGPEINIGTN